MATYRQPTEEEAMQALAPGLLKKILEQAQPTIRNKIQALFPTAKPAEKADFVSAVCIVASSGGMRDAASLSPITAALDKYVQKNNLPAAERERLLGELCVRYREILTLLYSSMDIFFPGWTQLQLAAGWEAAPINNTEVMKNEAGNIIGVKVNTHTPPPH